MHGVGLDERNGRFVSFSDMECCAFVVVRGRNQANRSTCADEKRECMRSDRWN